MAPDQKKKSLLTHSKQIAIYKLKLKKKRTIKTYLQFISIKKLFSSTFNNNDGQVPYVAGAASERESNTLSPQSTEYGRTKRSIARVQQHFTGVYREQKSSKLLACTDAYKLLTYATHACIACSLFFDVTRVH